MDSAPHTARVSDRHLTWSTGATLFISASLVFMVQPMVGKMLLPMLGGAAVVWNTCLVFFQLALLGGYLYAHVLSTRLPLARQIATHLVLLLVSLIFLPLAIDSVPSGEGSPVVWLGVTLAGTVGVPFMLLSATSPLLQSWFSRTAHVDADDPYHLYAASNAGSILGLVSYPLVVEPLIGLTTQTASWAVGYILLGFAIAGVGRFAWGRAVDAAARPTTSSEEGSELPVRLVFRWLALAAVPSALLVAVTNVCTLDVASIPLFWVIPLLLYLLTHVIAFSRRRLLGHATSAMITIPILLLHTFGVVLDFRPPSIWLMFAQHLVAFFFVALTLHGELARTRPPAIHSTRFYLTMAAGGVIGGAAVALVAPLAFDMLFEYPLALAAAAWLLPPAAVYADVPKMTRRIVVGAGGLALIAVLAYLRTMRATIWWVDLTLALLTAGLLAFSVRRPIITAVIFTLLCAGGSVVRMAVVGADDHHYRSYFGVYTVSTENGRRLMFHGSTLHGVQHVRPEFARHPTAYYTERGGAGRYLELLDREPGFQTIGVVGLGVGTLAAYSSLRREIIFYEIDPLLEEIARDPQHFTFLRDCGDGCEVVLGDARVQLNKVEPFTFDLLVEDAFTSDAVPLHLLTREAIAMYMQKLKPDGTVAFHISNNHLNLFPIFAMLAEDAGVKAVAYIHVTEAEDALPSWWVFFTHSPQRARALVELGGEPLLTSPGYPLWTDDYASVLDALQ